MNQLVKIQKNVTQLAGRHHLQLSLVELASGYCTQSRKSHVSVRIKVEAAKISLALVLDIRQLALQHSQNPMPEQWHGTEFQQTIRFRDISASDGNRIML